MRKPTKTKRQKVAAAGQADNIRVERAAAVSVSMEPRGKIGLLVCMLRQKDGATIDAMMSATGWQAHSIRGAMSGSVKKALGLNVISAKTDAGRVYRIVAGSAA